MYAAGPLCTLPGRSGRWQTIWPARCAGISRRTAREPRAPSRPGTAPVGASRRAGSAVSASSGARARQRQRPLYHSAVPAAVPDDGPLATRGRYVRCRGRRLRHRVRGLRPACRRWRGHRARGRVDLPGDRRLPDRKRHDLRPHRGGDHRHIDGNPGAQGTSARWPAAASSGRPSSASELSRVSLVPPRPHPACAVAPGRFCRAMSGVSGVLKATAAGRGADCEVGEYAHERDERMCREGWVERPVATATATATAATATGLTAGMDGRQGGAVCLSGGAGASLVGTGVVAGRTPGLCGSGVCSPRRAGREAPDACHSAARGDGGLAPWRICRGRRCGGRAACRG